MSKENFDAILAEAVDEGLSSIGESCKQALYFHLETRFDVKKHEIPSKVEAFSHAIEQIFGMGARFLEILIMKRLYEKVEFQSEWNDSQDFTFPKYVAAARRSFLTKKRAETSVPSEQMMVKG